MVIVSKPSIFHIDGRLVEREVCGVVAYEKKLAASGYTDRVRSRQGYRGLGMRFGRRHRQGKGAGDDGFDRRSRPGLILESFHLRRSIGEPGRVWLHSALYL
jgi:hypothetical protein